MKHQFNSKSTNKFFDTPGNHESSTKKKKLNKVVNINSEDEESDSGILTMNDWKQNIVAYDTPMKEENLPTKVLPNYRKQLNFEPLVKYSNGKKSIEQLSKNNFSQSKNNLMDEER